MHEHERSERAVVTTLSVDMSFCPRLVATASTIITTNYNPPAVSVLLLCACACCSQWPIDRHQPLVADPHGPQLEVTFNTFRSKPHPPPILSRTHAIKHRLQSAVHCTPARSSTQWEDVQKKVKGTSRNRSGEPLPSAPTCNCYRISVADWRCWNTPARHIPFDAYCSKQWMHTASAIRYGSGAGFALA